MDLNRWDRERMRKVRFKDCLRAPEEQIGANCRWWDGQDSKVFCGPQNTLRPTYSGQPLSWLTVVFCVPQKPVYMCNMAGKPSRAEPIAVFVATTNCGHTNTTCLAIVQHCLLYATVATYKYLLSCLLLIQQPQVVHQFSSVASLAAMRLPWKDRQVDRLGSSGLLKRVNWTELN